MDDLISREAAIDATKKHYRAHDNDMLELIAFDIEQLPSAQPERKKGKWVRRKGSDCWECSECHAVMESDDIASHNFYYCYHCGADMMNEYGYMKLEGTDHE